MGLHTTWDTIVRKAERLRVDLPRAPLAAYQRMVDTVEQATDGPDRGEVRQAITTAALAGKDAEPTLSASPADVKAALQKAADQLLIEHAEDLFAAFTPRFDEAAGMLRQAVAALPRVFNLERPTVSNKRTGHEPLSAQGDDWQRARYADQVLVEVGLLWKFLAMSSAPFPVPSKHAPLILAEVSPELWLEMRRAETTVGHLRPWNYAQMGVDFELATPATFRERRDRVAAGLQALDEERSRPVPPWERTVPADDPLAYVP